MKFNSAALVTGGLFIIVMLSGLASAEADNTQEDPARTALIKQIRELHWIKGPQKVQLFGNSTLNVPDGYVFLNPEDTAKLQSMEHNLSGGAQYYFAPKALSWGATFSFRDDGYVKDDEKIDADGILKNIEANTAAGNKTRRERGWDEMQVVGWQTQPHYDTQSNRLEWAINGKDLKTNDLVVNFNTRILGRGGVMSVVLVTSPELLTTSIADFKNTLFGFEYTPGQRYAEYKPGDKVAKYGLAALVTGGAAAIAVKTGLWKVIAGALVAGWKFVAAAVLGLFSWVGRRFRRNTH